MNTLIAFDFAFDGNYGDQQDQPFRIIEPAAPAPVAYGMREVGDFEKRFEVVSNIFDPFEIQFGWGDGFGHTESSCSRKMRDDFSATRRAYIMPYSL